MMKTQNIDNVTIMDVFIRRTTENYFSQTEHITREAFWNLYKPGCDEHLVLHNLRKSRSYISNLDLVAVAGNEVIGHIISTKAKVIDLHDNAHEVLCAGPFSVLPEFQKQGIGSKLMNKTIEVARELGYAGIILFGNPDYYHRFGFRNAAEYNITTKDAQNFEPFMALKLQNKGLTNVNGRFFEADEFETDPDELTEFEKQFPYKEKLVTDTQLK
jgi:predicted N-acetyltransferase YhbS